MVADMPEIERTVVADRKMAVKVDMRSSRSIVVGFDFDTSETAA